MRPTCLDCAGKHLAQACILLKETKTGYPAFRWFVIGHLAEAEAETVRDYPELANEIREQRVAWDADESVIIPFEELLAKIDELLEAEELFTESSSSPDDEQTTARFSAPLVIQGVRREGETVRCAEEAPIKSDTAGVRGTGLVAGEEAK